MDGGTDGATPTRVTSRDGTQIGFWTSGAGPPLVLVHGAPADHTRWRPLLPHLEPHVTVHALDRRGRGASGDGPDYHLTREFEDVAAVVDAVAEASGSRVDVYGHSFGGLCAFGGAALTGNVRRLVLYEGWPLVRPEVTFGLPPGLGERLRRLLEDDDREGVVETVLRDLAGATEDELRALRAQPSWQARVAAAHTIPRELQAVTDAPLVAEQARRISARALLLVGSDSTDASVADVEAVAAALGDARVVVLAGEQHVADVLAPDVVAGHVLPFLRGDG